MDNNCALRIKPTVQVLKSSGRIYLRSSCAGSEIEDETGLIGDIFDQLDGTRSADGITKIVASARGEAATWQVPDVLKALDHNLLLEDASLAAPDALDHHDLERWSRNLDFLGSYCKTAENKYVKQLEVKNARIALLGLGGLGSHLLYDLAAFGFCNIRSVDYDVVELANLNRQILYSEADIGRPKTEAATKRIREFNPRINFEAVNTRLSSMSDVAAIVEGMDAVVCVADKPTYLMAGWLNEACVRAGVPFIHGGVDNQCAVYYTVIPHQTGCAECWKLHVQSRDGLSADFLANEIVTEASSSYAGPAIVPLVSVLTGFMASELIRLVTGVTPPVATNRLRATSFTTALTEDAETWERVPECPVCGTP